MGWDSSWHGLGRHGMAAHRMVIAKPWELTPPHGPARSEKCEKTYQSLCQPPQRDVFHDTPLARWGSCCRRKMLRPRTGKVW